MACSDAGCVHGCCQCAGGAVPECAGGSDRGGPLRAGHAACGVHAWHPVDFTAWTRWYVARQRHIPLCCLSGCCAAATPTLRPGAQNLCNFVYTLAWCSTYCVCQQHGACKGSRLVAASHRPFPVTPLMVAGPPWCWPPCFHGSGPGTIHNLHHPCQH